MHSSSIPPENMRQAALGCIRESGLKPAAALAGVHPSTLAKVAAGSPVSAGTLARLARIVDRTRKAAEFTGSVALTPPRRESSLFGAWDLEKIRHARDQQMVGHFKLPVRLAEAVRTDDALFTAYHNRIAPQAAVQTRIVPANGARGEAVARRANASCYAARTTLASIAGTLVNHAIAIGYNHQETNEDGTRVDFELTEWPLEWVTWNTSKEILETSVRDGGAREPIIHGNGRWTIFRKFKVLPWTQDACLLPAAFIWAAHANGIRDWAGGSRSHGQAKVMGELPAGVMAQLVDSDGNLKLTDEALGFLQMLTAVMSGESGVGIRPAGSKTDMLTNTSMMYQVFSELILSRERASSRVYTGTDAALGAAGGAPGVDISMLFGVQSTKVQGDFNALEQGLITGLYQPWCAVNDGDSRYAPGFEYLLPDPDAAEKSAENDAKFTRLFTQLQNHKTNGMIVNQGVVDRLAKLLGIAAGDIPQLATVTAAAPGITALGQSPEPPQRSGNTGVGGA